METNYYIPDISEFKQGFKFQRLTSKKRERIGGFIILNEDGTKDEKWLYSDEDRWLDCEVWWDRKPSEEVKEMKLNDIIIYYKECEIDLMPNYDLNGYLNNKRIRAEWKN